MYATRISEGVADMHCFSDEYLAEELAIERNKNFAHYKTIK